MIIGDTLTIGEQTYEISDEQKDRIHGLWEAYLDSAREAESLHAAALEKEERSNQFLDDANPSRDAYKLFRTAALEVVRGEL